MGARGAPKYLRKLRTETTGTFKSCPAWIMLNAVGSMTPGFKSTVAMQGSLVPSPAGKFPSLLMVPLSTTESTKSSVTNF